MMSLFSSTVIIAPATPDDTDVHSKVDDGEGVLVGEIVAQMDRQAVAECQAAKQFVHGAALVHAGGLELEYTVPGLQFMAGYITRQFLRGIVQCGQLPGRAVTMQGEGHALRHRATAPSEPDWREAAVWEAVEQVPR
ncbi:MAG: hypothetical protein ABI870_00495 [Rhodanobacter sp.]